MFAESSKACYRSQLNTYYQFCQRMGYCSVPLNNMHLYRYVAYLATFLKVRSVKQYLNVVRLIHVESGLPNPMTGDPFLSGLLKGMRRVKGDAVNRKLPITIDMLLRMRGLLDISKPRELCFWTACLLAFYGMLRKSSLFPRGGNAGLYITLGDCHVREWGLIVYLKQSKTIQFQERQAYVSLPWNANKRLCAARHLMLNARGIPQSRPDAFIFTFCTGNSTRVMTYQMFTSMLRSLVLQLNLPVERISGHSLRRGGASLALKCGVPPEMIKAQGDWKSLSYLDYLDVTDQKDRATYIQQMCSQL